MHPELFAVLAATFVAMLAGANGQRTLVARIVRGGVKGTVTFQQSSANDDVTVTSALTGVVNPYRLEVMTFWTLLDISSPCTERLLGNSLRTLPEMTSGNVTVTVNSSTVTLHGANGIAGRSVAVVKDNVRVSCGTLRTPGANHSYSATFRKGVMGSVFFLQTQASEARVLADLYTEESLPPAGSFHWGIHTGSSCSDTGDIYDGTVGDLQARLGSVPVGVLRGQQRQDFLDLSLSLPRLGGRRTLVLRSPGGGVVACAVLTPVARRQAVADFHVDGVKGQVTFTQESMLDATSVKVVLSGLSEKASGFHVHEFPVAVRVGAEQPLCGEPQVGGHFNPFGVDVHFSPSASTGSSDQYEVGDLSGKYGTLDGRNAMEADFQDSNLALMGRHSVVGRSLVIHKVNGSRWVCTNIQDRAEVTVAVAYFRAPVVGFLMLTESSDHPGTTSVYLAVTGAEGHNLTFTANPAGVDAAAETGWRCASTGSVWNPFQAKGGGQCGPTDPLRCPLGDVSARLGEAHPRGAAAKFFGTDWNLFLSGAQGVLNRAAVLSKQGTKVACATLREVHQRQAFTQPLQPSQAAVTLTQRHGLLQTPTRVAVRVPDTQGQVQGFGVHQRPLPGGTAVCSNVTAGGLFDPFHVASPSNYPAPSSATPDKYQVGDLSGKFGLMTSAGNWTVGGEDWTLSVFGPLSVVGRSLVVRRKDGSWACHVIQEASAATGSRQITATAVFSGLLSGSVVLTQFAYADGSLTDTSITVDLRYSGNPDRVTRNHNWHVHIRPVGADGHASSPCQSCGDHYDPFKAKARANYSDNCGPLTPLQCEIGDQSSKLGTYSIGTGPQLFSDIDLPLTGTFAAMGRSVVVHAEEKGAARLACADILPSTAFSSTATYKVPGNMEDRLRMAEEIASALRTEASNVVVQGGRAEGGCFNTRVFFTGFDPRSLKQTFDHMMATGTMPNMEQPSTTCVAPVHGPSWWVALLLAALLL